jgi:chromosome partitioning protein
MGVTAFLHQKGGTGKSTLAVAASIVRAAEGQPVLLVDADPQGTASEWAQRFGRRFGVEYLNHTQPTFPGLIGPLRKQWPVIVIDGPPSLSEVTESILRASDRVIIPIRPSMPDLWSLPWFAAVVRKLQREGRSLDALLVFNMYLGEPLEPLLAEARKRAIPIWDEPIPSDPGFAAMFAGEPLPDTLAQTILRLVDEPPSAA